MNRRFLFSLVMIAILSGCASKLPVKEIIVDSPLGLYRSDTAEKVWLAILQDDRYLICDTRQCNSGNYERVAVNYGVILVDFYKTEIGQLLENDIHGNTTAEFIDAMRRIRKAQRRPDDLVFNLRSCGELICAAIGHSRDGVKFYKVESFDEFWTGQQGSELNDY